MYAKLVVGASAGNLYQCLRDICRLLTSAAPSMSDLSGLGFSTSLSSIMDATPAGWTFVGSTKSTDQAGIGAGSADATFSTTTYHAWALSAPMANSASLKYALLNQSCISASTVGPTVFSLSGATSVTSLGVATNEGYRPYSATVTTGLQNATHAVAASATFHVIANPRHITIIREGRGMMALWETTTGEINTFYNKGVSFCTLSHALSTEVSVSTAAVPSTVGTSVIGASIFDIVDPNTGTAYGTYSPVNNYNGPNNYPNAHFFLQLTLNARPNTYDAAGNQRYQVTPVFVNCTNVGQPVQYVTGVVPVYWCKAALGSTGDTVSINSEDYLFFNCGAAGASFGLLMQTA
jgi:hypothetical protein